MKNNKSELFRKLSIYDTKLLSHDNINYYYEMNYFQNSEYVSK